MFNPYIDVIGQYYPNVNCHAVGLTYEDIVNDGTEPIPNKSVLDPLILEYQKNLIWQKIKAYRDTHLENGGFPVGSYWFHSDVYAQANYTDLLMMGANIPANLMWKTMSGAFVLMTQTLAQQILGAKALQKNLTFIKAEQHKAALQASSDPLNYDYTTGWPPIYGE
jgi:Domain of unknown function (DUF4376)